MTAVEHNVPAEPDAPKLDRREAAKIRTAAKILSAAKTAFSDVSRPYATVTMRAIASAAGVSTGAIFNSWKGKDDLWREAMGCEPPIDTPVVRAAPNLLSALRGLIAVRPSNWNDDEDPDRVAAWTAADTAIALAEGLNREGATA
jgi:hypothetical protein